MRFEIKSGGVAAILVGIAALSGAVFMLGLLAGYDVGRESTSSTAQVATAYPVAAPPSSGAATSPAVSAVAVAPRPAPSTEEPDAASSPDAEASPETIAARPVAVKHPKPSAHAIEEEDEPPSERAAAEVPPPAGEGRASRSRADSADDTDEDTPDAGATPASARRATVPSASAMASANPAHGANQRHRPYNIQIEAAMDSAGANAMLQRLQTLGYPTHLVPARLNGQTWYKVVIGPYPTQEAAAAAQSEMRAKYNSTYSSSAGGSKPSD